MGGEGGGEWAGVLEEEDGQALGEGQALPFAHQSAEEEPDFLGGCRKGGPRRGLGGVSQGTCPKEAEAPRAGAVEQRRDPDPPSPPAWVDRE